MMGAAVLCWTGCGPSDGSTPKFGRDDSAALTADQRARTDTTGEFSTTTSSTTRILTASTTMAPNLVEVIEEAFDAVIERRIECGRRPHRCDVDSLAVEGSSLHDRLTALMAERRAAGITASPRGSVRHRIDDIRLHDGRAQVTACLTDDTVLMSAGAIFDESLFSAVTVWTMERVDDDWLWVDDRVVRWSRTEDLCDFPR